MYLLQIQTGDKLLLCAGGIYLCRYALVLRVHLQERITANQYSVILTDHLYSISILMGVVALRMTPPPSTVHDDSLNGEEKKQNKTKPLWL